MNRILAESVVALAAAFVLAIPVAHAHEGMQHVKGVVQTVTDREVVIDWSGTEVRIALDATTKYEGVAGVKDLKAGQRVVVHAKNDGGLLKATLVKVASPAPPAAPPQHGGHGHH